MKNKYIGKWRIREMEHWDQNFIDLDTPGYFLFEKDKSGHFQFVAIEGEIDYRIEEVGGVERIEFSWVGYDEGDPVSGRGWAVSDGNELHGKIYFHMGDGSWFKAKRKTK